MKQVLLRKGRIVVEDIPAPAKDPHHILVEVTRSLISTGTEISHLNQAQSSLLSKVTQKPEMVTKAIQSIKVRGLSKTWALVHHYMDKLQPLGYSAVGRVLHVGERVTEFQVGMTVACAGSGVANHAEIISVPKNLAVPVPVGVSDEQASFMTVGAIALQGVRRSESKIGESVLVIGLGLIGQLTVQLLKAAGCRVIGCDVDSNRVAMATKCGLELGSHQMEEIQTLIRAESNSYGVDATIITASSPASELVQFAFEQTRKKGKIVVVGSVGMDLKRSPFYEKEQDFLISSSYGPGRYDQLYEDHGQDYPYPYVRWTENRNMEAFLQLLKTEKIKIDPLIDKVVPVQQAQKAYDELNASTTPKPLAIVLSYTSGVDGDQKQKSSVVQPAKLIDGQKIKIGLVGVGEFTRSTHLPNLEKISMKAEVTAVCTKSGVNASTYGRQLNATLTTTDYQDLIKDTRVNAVLIATRHHQHADMALETLRAGKHVFVEKPLALSKDQLNKLVDELAGLNSSPVLMVGFNRRFSPHALRLRELLSSRQGPLVMTYRVNASPLPLDHWVHSEEGGGRLRGEACHMIDFFRFLTQSPLQSMSIDSIKNQTNQPIRPDENFSAQFVYEDGSLSHLIYESVGHKDLAKERIELHWDGKSVLIEDFKNLTVWGSPGSLSLHHQDKGHLACLDTFVNSVRNGVSFPIPWDQLVETTRATLELHEELWSRSS